MNDRREASESSAEARADLRRCPACGQKLDSPPPPRCPLCRHDFGVSSHATGEDHTLYAQAYTTGESSFWSMGRWVVLADTPRLKHLALIRVSAASRRFATLALLLASAGLGLIQVGRSGWHATPASAAVGPQQPLGAGWIHVVAAPSPLPADLPPDEPVHLWWNPAQSIIGAAVAFGLGWIVLCWLLALLQWSVNRAHAAPYRAERRLSAGLRYGTVFLVALLPSGFIALLRPVGQMTEIAGLSIAASPQAIAAVASVPAALAVVLWWFWLTRLGATAPPRTRGRVLACLTLGVPLLLLLAGAAWWSGLRFGLPPLYRALGVQF